MSPHLVMPPIGLLLMTGLTTEPHGRHAFVTDTVHYTVTLGGNHAGEQTVIGETDGSRRVLFEFNDRGRGPRVEAQYEMGDAGIPVRITITGIDYFKAKVDERYTLDAGRARWTSTAEQGNEVVSTAAVYVALQEPPEGAAILARALLESPTHSLKLLPAGSAKIEVQTERSLTVRGQSRTARYYLITGLGMTPNGLWLEPDGTLFAQASGWTSVIREGWEEVIPSLLAVQDSIDVARDREAARQLADRPRGPVAFTGVSLFDADRGELVENTTVLVEGNRIVRVGPAADFALPAGTRQIDGRGKTLLPGLWDMHAHTSDVDGPLNIGSGITSVRDLANTPEELAERQRRWDSGETIGPRIVKAGFIDGPGPFAGPTKALVTTPEEMRRWIDWYADHGYEQIKLYSSLKPELVAVAAERAHARGLRLSGHIPAHMRARDAIHQGYDEIQHINMVVLNFLSDTLDTRTPVRFIEPGKHALDLDLTSDSVRSFIQLLADRHIVVDPTLATFEGLFTTRPGEMAEGDTRIAVQLPSQVRRALLGGGLPADEALVQRYRASYRQMLALVKTMHDAGVQLVAGTDCLAGFCLQRELELYSEAGIPNADVLRIATIGAATVTGRANQLGSVRQGKLADLVLIDGNPLLDMRQIRRVSLVMKDGVIYDPADVQRTLSITPWQDLRPTP